MPKDSSKLYMKKKSFVAIIASLILLYIASGAVYLRKTYVKIDGKIYKTDIQEISPNLRYTNIKEINRCTEVEDNMSVSLTISKWIDSERNSREFIVDIPVSFQSVWNQVWEPAIIACDVQFFKCCNVFTTEQIPKVLEELARIYDLVQVNGAEDTSYITERIRDELKPFLTEFYQEHKGENYRFSVG